MRESWVMPLAMFLGTVAWTFVYVSLPFHIQAISARDEIATLRWTGWILGITPLVTVALAPMWGRWAEHGDPKRFYVVVEMLQGLAFLGLVAARTLPELFLARLVLGLLGAASTFAFMLAGRAPDEGQVRRRVAAIQSSMTVGQVIGPLVGAVAAARLGFRESFAFGGCVLLGCAALVHWGVPTRAPRRVTEVSARPTQWREVLTVSAVVIGGSTQVFFLTAILPQVVPTLGIPRERALEVGGLLIFVSGVAAALGAVAAPRLADVFPEGRLLTVLLLASSVAVAALSLAASVWSYGALRFVQVLCIAPVFPIVVARVAQTGGGTAIGVINSGRIGAAFVGPVIATTMLGWTSPPPLYLLLALLGVASVPFAMARGRSERMTT